LGFLKAEKYDPKRAGQMETTFPFSFAVPTCPLAASSAPPSRSSIYLSNTLTPMPAFHSTPLNST
jgi:hypothetical protein